MKAGNDIKTFLNFIKNEKYWKYFEVRACALKDNKKGLFFAYVKLSKIKGKNKVFVSDNHKFYIENFEIDELENFFIRLSENNIKLNEEQFSFHPSNNFFYDFKERKYSKENFNIDYPCHRLFGEINKFSDYNKIINYPLKSGGSYYKNLGDACKEFLGIKFGGGYSPHIQILAPVYVKIDKAVSLGNLLEIKLYAELETSLKDLELIVYGEKEDGTQTKFNKVIKSFNRINKDNFLEPFQFVLDDEATYIVIILRYRNETIENFYLKKIVIKNDTVESRDGDSISIRLPPSTHQRPLTPIVPPSIEQSELRKKKEDIKRKYELAKNTVTPNQKGKLLEQVMSEIFSLVEGLIVVDSRFNDRIQEVDLVVRNKNKTDIWSEMDGIFFVECKNWEEKVGSSEISSFIAKLRRYGIKSGIFVALNGVTGENYIGGSGAIRLELISNIRVIVIDGKDIDAILNCKDVTSIVDKKYIEMYVGE